MIAALYIARNGSYINLAGVDPWHETRDARLYAGPHPVVAHPPCQRWGKLWAGQPLHIKRTGQRKIKGDDGGCFEAALSAVRSWGGVLEHPCDSHAWAHTAFYETLPTYRRKCIELGADQEQIAAVDRLIGRATDWRQDNADRCKVPDAKGEKLIG